MEFSKVDKKAKKMWRLTRILTLLFVIVPACVITFLVANGSDAGWVGLSISAVLIGIMLITIIVYPIIEYIQWAYLVTGDRIEIKKGIFFKSHVIVPVSRIQHVNVSQGPIARIFGLAKVEIHTAGGSFEIEGLNNQVANEIGDKLRNLVNQKIGLPNCEKA